MILNTGEAADVTLSLRIVTDECVVFDCVSAYQKAKKYFYQLCFAGMVMIG